MTIDEFEKELIKRDILDQDQLQIAKAEAKKFNSRLTSAIISLGYLDSAKMAVVVSEVFELKTVSIKRMTIDPAVTKAITKKECQQYHVIPIHKTNSELILAISDPTVIVAKPFLEQITKHKVTFYVTPEEYIPLTIEKLYGPDIKNTQTPAQTPIKESTQVSAPSTPLTALNQTPPASIAEPKASPVPPQSPQALITPTEASPQQTVAPMKTPAPAQPVVKNVAPQKPLVALKGDVSQMVNSIITEAIKRKSSDIHIEQFEKKYRIRYRIDGSMVEAFAPGTGPSLELVSRIKVLSKLDVSERRRPQDGRAKFQIGPEKFVDIRVNILPTLFGEKVVMRILDKDNLTMGIQSLGFSEYQLQQVGRCLNKPQGMILVTGPTGSGKTTTLYSALYELNDITNNISTAEDPVEFYVDGINQVQINSDIGFNFSEALRAFLRQDPDVIMVGEIRDTETATIAFKAASTGHLVLSTLHTNDAINTIYRLIDMGVPKYIVAEGTTLIIAQRLLRKNCSSCTQPEPLSTESLTAAGVLPQDLKAYANTCAGSGCEACNYTGTKGRVAIHEVLEMNPALRTAIVKGAAIQEFRNIAMKHGMISLRGRALQLMQQGIVSYQEVLGGTVSDDAIELEAA